jgi:hypothetical protein
MDSFTAFPLASFLATGLQASASDVHQAAAAYRPSLITLLMLKSPAYRAQR